MNEFDNWDDWELEEQIRSWQHHICEMPMCMNGSMEHKRISSIIDDLDTELYKRKYDPNHHRKYERYEE